MELSFQKPRKIFIFLGSFTIVLVLGILYINYFVPELKFGRINVVSPYQVETKRLSEKLAEINSFQSEGEIKIDLSPLNFGLKNIVSKPFFVIDVTKNNFKLDLSSLLQFNASSKK